MHALKSYLKNHYPGFWNFLKKLRHPAAPLPTGLWLINIIFQRLFKINGSVPWMVHYTSYVTLPERIEIGEDVWISFAVSGGCYIQGGNGIKIGDRTIFAPGVKIISANHNPANLKEWTPGDPIVIGKDCWLGANAVILPGVRLGDGCTVGAGAVVTSSFPSGSLLAGVPARNIVTERNP